MCSSLRGRQSVSSPVPAPRRECGSARRPLLCRAGEQRDFDKAAEYPKRAIQIAPDDGGYHYNALGVAYLQQGRMTEAAAEFQKAIDHDSPTWTFPRHDLAFDCILEDGDYSAAEGEYREAIARAGDQQTGYLHHNLGLLAHQLGKRKEAQIEYETALKLFQEQKNGAGGSEQCAGTCRGFQE